MFIWIAELLVYAIVGGPGVGKTSVIDSLRAQSEIVADEAATNIIRDQQSHDIPCPWENPNFNFQVSLSQEEREQIACQRATLQKKPRIFVDRGILDPLVYEEMDLHSQPLKIEKLESYHRLKSRVSRLINGRYAKIFFVLPYSTSSRFQVIKTAVRKETTEESKAIANYILDVYKRFIPEDNIVFVPGDATPQERAAFILSYLDQENTSVIQQPMLVKKSQ